MALWRKVWSLDVPSKAKHLLWRISNDFLPEYVYIRGKVVANDLSCFSIDGKDESVTHTLFKCEYARVVWFASPLNLRVEDMIILDSMSESVLLLCHVLNDDTLALWAMLAWGLWFNRNTRCQGKTGFEPIELIEKVLKELNEFQKRKSDVQMVDMQDVEKMKWVAPSEDWVKINYHVSHLYSKCLGIGCVIRDDMGDVVGCFVDRLDLEAHDDLSRKDVDLLMVDVQKVAMYESFLFGLNMGFRLIILESDHMPMVHKLQSREWKTTEEVVKLIATYVKRNPNGYVVDGRYTGHYDNQLAESLADFAIEVDELTVWIDELPPKVINVDMM